MRGVVLIVGVTIMIGMWVFNRMEAPPRELVDRLTERPTVLTFTMWQQLPLLRQDKRNKGKQRRIW